MIMDFNTECCTTSIFWFSPSPKIPAVIRPYSIHGKLLQKYVIQ